MNHNENIEKGKVIVDKITAVYNWAMQTPDWKLLNVLFEIVDVK